jgi:hypothetical protein
MAKRLKCPDALSVWTPDQVAECVDGITPATYRELWGVLNEPKFRKRAMGGDGSNGTTELPDDGGGDLRRAWRVLSDDAKANIIAAAEPHEKELRDMMKDF